MIDPITILTSTEICGALMLGKSHDKATNETILIVGAIAVGLIIGYNLSKE